MGVNNLWPLLSSSCQTGVSLKQLRGQIVAVDISIWILEFKKSKGANEFANLYLRNLFHRVLHLLKCNIKPVFVFDGKAPEIKQATMLKRQENESGNNMNNSTGSINLDRTRLRPYHEKCREMLEYFGFPCLQSDGEAEALCAKLNKNGEVDGVITNDSDVFLYGATTVYRNFRKDDRDECCVDIYKIDQIKEDLGLDRRSLIAAGLLIGCDYDQKGVDHIGPKKALKLMRHLKQITDDPLNRICGWRTNKDLIELQSQFDSLEGKESHCSRCKHLGTLPVHNKSGCSDCEMEVSCNADNSKKCQCKHHVLDMHNLELKLRSKAMEEKSFPNQEIIDEYLNEKDIGPCQKLSWQPIKLQRLHQFLENHLKSLRDKLFYEKIVPVLAYLHLQNSSWCIDGESTIKPVRVIKYCKVKTEDCVQTEWTKLVTDKVTQSEHYTVKVNKELFCKRYLRLVEEYDKSRAELKKHKSKKRKMDDVPANQTSMMAFYQVTKKPKVVHSNIKTSSPNSSVDSPSSYSDSPKSSSDLENVNTGKGSGLISSSRPCSSNSVIQID